MFFKISVLVVGLLSILGSWVISVSFLWSPRGVAANPLYDAASKVGVVLLCSNVLFLIFLSWKMFFENKFLHSKALTFFLPVIVSVLCALYHFVLSNFKPAPVIYTEHPSATKEMEKK